MSGHPAGVPGTSGGLSEVPRDLCKGRVIPWYHPTPRATAHTGETGTGQWVCQGLPHHPVHCGYRQSHNSSTGFPGLGIWNLTTSKMLISPERAVKGQPAARPKVMPSGKSVATATIWPRCPLQRPCVPKAHIPSSSPASAKLNKTPPLVIYPSFAQNILFLLFF